MLIPVVAVLGVLSFIGVAIYLSHRYEKARTERCRAIATELGLPFEEVSFSKVESGVAGLRLFEQGHSRKFKNMMLGDTDDVDMAIFDYRFTVGHGKHQQTHAQSIVYFGSPDWQIPNFEIRPEGFFHKIGKAFGYQDINFDGHPEFSKKYLLRGEDETAIRQFFRPEIMDLFVGMKDICVEASDSRFVLYRSRKRVKPEEIRDLMTEGFRVFRTLSQGQTNG